MISHFQRTCLAWATAVFAWVLEKADFDMTGMLPWKMFC